MGKKKSRRPAAVKTQVLLVPVVEGPEMERMLESIARKRGRCGKCDRIAGVTWCNVDVPKRTHTLTLSKIV